MATRDELLVEARQVVLGMVNARVRSDVTDTRFLLHAWIAQCQAAGVSDIDAWAIYATAATVWTTQLIHSKAQQSGYSVEQVVQDLAAATAEWAVNGGG